MKIKGSQKELNKFLETRKKILKWMEWVMIWLSGILVGIALSWIIGF